MPLTQLIVASLLWDESPAPTTTKTRQKTYTVWAILFNWSLIVFSTLCSAAFDRMIRNQEEDVSNLPLSFCSNKMSSHTYNCRIPPPFRNTYPPISLLKCQRTVPPVMCASTLGRGVCLISICLDKIQQNTQTETLHHCSASTCETASVFVPCRSSLRCGSRILAFRAKARGIHTWTIRYSYMWVFQGFFSTRLPWLVSCSEISINLVS